MDKTLNSMSKQELKLVAKNLGIDGTTFKNTVGFVYSKAKKGDIVSIINKHNASIKIQKMFRNRWVKDNTCPITLEEIKYPVFAYRPIGSSGLIYYNLEILAKYLINTGNFRDPKTRQEYSVEILKNIDMELKKNKIKVELNGVYNAFRNKKHYKEKKSREDMLLILDRCIDEVVSEIRKYIEQNCPRYSDIELLLTSFKTYIEKVCSVSKNECKRTLERTINSINNTLFSHAISYIDKEYILLYMYSIQFDLEGTDL